MLLYYQFVFSLFAADMHKWITKKSFKKTTKKIQQQKKKKRVRWKQMNNSKVDKAEKKNVDCNKNQKKNVMKIKMKNHWINNNNLFLITSDNYECETIKFNKLNQFIYQKEI